MGKRKCLKLSNKNEREEHILKIRLLSGLLECRGLRKRQRSLNLEEEQESVSGCGSPERRLRTAFLGLGPGSTGRSLGDGELIKESEK